MDVQNHSNNGGDAHAFNPDRAKMFLSLRWLVHHGYCHADGGYGSTMPKELLLERPVNGYQAAGSGAFCGLHLSVALLSSLASGDLYRKACAKLFPKWTTDGKGHSSVLQALLSNCGILVMSDDGAAVSEQDLRATRPFNIAAHLALIDSIMAAAIAEQASVAEIVLAIRSFQTAPANPKWPTNHEDALMLWMATAASSAAAALGMTAVSDALCKGSASCVLALALTIAAYQPQQLNAKDILSEAAVSVIGDTYSSDRVLRTVKSFCENNIAHVPFDFTSSDLSKDSLVYLKCHIAALLSELFVVLARPSSLQPDEGPTTAGPSPATPGPDSRGRNSLVNGTYRQEPGGYSRPYQTTETTSVASAAAEGPTKQRPPQSQPVAAVVGLSSPFARHSESGPDKEPVPAPRTSSQPPPAAPAAARPPSPGSSVGARTDRLLTVVGLGSPAGTVSGASAAASGRQQQQQAMADRSWHAAGGGQVAAAAAGRYAGQQQQEALLYGGHLRLSGAVPNHESPVAGVKLDFGSSPQAPSRQQQTAASAVNSGGGGAGSASRSILSLQEKWKKESELKGRLGSGGGAVSPVNFSVTAACADSSAPVLLSPTRDDPAVVRGDADGRTDGHGSSSSASPSSSPSPKHRESAENGGPAGAQYHHASLMRPQSPFGLAPAEQQQPPLATGSYSSSSSASPPWSSAQRSGQAVTATVPTPSKRSDVATSWASAYASPQQHGASAAGADDSFRLSPATAGTSSSSALPRRPEQAAWAAYSSHQSLLMDDDAFRGGQQQGPGASSTLPRKPANRSSPLKAFMAATAARSGQSPAAAEQAAAAGQGGGGSGLMSSSQLRRMYGSMSSLNLAGIGGGGGGGGGDSPLQSAATGRASPGLLLANRLTPASHAAAASGSAHDGSPALRGGSATAAPDYSRSSLGVGGGKASAAATRLDDYSFVSDGQGHSPALRQPSWDSNRSFPTSDRPSSPMSSGTASSGRTTPAMTTAGASTASAATKKRATWNRVSPAGDSGLRGLEVGAAAEMAFSGDGSFGQPSEEELARMKERVMLLELRRKEEAEQRRQEKEAEAQRRRDEQRLQEMEFERKKQEEKQRRERILEQHQLSKREEQDRPQPLPFASSPAGSAVQLRSRASPARAARNSVNRHSYAGGGGVGTGAIDFYSSLSNIAEHPMPGDVQGAGPTSANVFERLTAPSPVPGMTGAHGQNRQNGGHNYYGHAEPQALQQQQQQSMYGGMGGASAGPSATLTRYGSMSSLSARAPTPAFGQFERPATQDGIDPLKLFVAPSFKSNRSIIINAISHCVLPGAVNADVKSRVLEDIARSDAKHLLILFRDARLQYRGVYAFNIDTGEATKICGQGPKGITEDMLEGFYKYNSGSKSFSVITSTHHLSVTIDAMTIKDTLWQKPLGPAAPPPFPFRRI